MVEGRIVSPQPFHDSSHGPGPATKPSIDIVMFSFSWLIDPPSVDMLEGPPRASEVIEQARSLTKLATNQVNAIVSGLMLPSD
jgi:hypothetical protein